MANRTVKDAHTIHGTNPQYLIPKIIRSRIYECRYWKEECFALTAELLVDKAVELKYVGGVYGGNTQPTPFLCLILKMLQIQPDKDIVIEFIKQAEHKYCRALGAFYLRLVGESLESYKYLEPLYNDYRQLKIMDNLGKFSLTWVDEFIDQLLVEDRVLDIVLPRIQKRTVMEENNLIESRQSVLDEDLEDLAGQLNVEEEMEGVEEQHYSHREMERPSRRAPRSRSRSKERRRRSRSRERRRSRSRERRLRSRSRERQPRHRAVVSPERKKHRKDREKERERGDRPERGADRRDRRDRGDRRDRNGDRDMEIREANALRAKLGIAPLRP